MHGGDIYRNQVHTDFSVNVNPLGVPEQVREALLDSLSCIQAYPDDRCETLREKLAMRYDLAKEHILCGNGASELIHAICRWKNPRKALLTAPSFSGYQRALRAEKCAITHFYLREEDDFALSEEMVQRLCEKINGGAYDLFFLTNPSNPIGSLTNGDVVRRIAKACVDADVTLVVDECFMELTPEPERHSLTKACREYPGVIILRAFTKTFAIPGIRLGYLICGDQEITTKIRAQLPEWNVSILAQAAGIAALGQEGYLKASRSFIKSQRDWLSGELQKLGARVYGSDANYLTFRWKDDTLYERLLKKGFLIRDCSDYEGLGKGYYRIAVRNRMENEALLQAMKEDSGSGEKKR